MLIKKEVIAFVDWNSQCHNAGQSREMRIERKVEKTADYIVETVARILSTIDKADRFDVTLRLYYGWHRGLTKTESRAELERQISQKDLPNRRGKCMLNWKEAFGDRLLSAGNHRLNKRLNIHLPDTLRAEATTGTGEREKMVDTALVSDLLCATRSSPQACKMVLAEDDDFVPALYVAEQWSNSGGRCFMVRTHGSSDHLSLNGLVINPRG